MAEYARIHLNTEFAQNITPAADIITINCQARSGCKNLLHFPAFMLSVG
jgi:hypothetical protein